MPILRRSAGIAVAGLAALALVLVAQQRTPRPTPVAPPVIWEYGTRVLYNWVPAARVQISEDELQRDAVGSLHRVLQDAGSYGWEVADIATVSGVASQNPRLASKKLFVVFKRRRP